MTAIWINEKSGVVRVASDAKAALKFGNGGFAFTTPEELAADGRIQTKMLVDIFNNYASDGKAVTKFSDRKTAARRVFQAVVSNEPVTEDSSTPEPNPLPTPAPAPATPKATNGKRGAKGKREKRIFPIDGKDPFKSGASAVTWKMIKDEPGLTFNQYIAKGGRANTIAGAIRNKWVRLED